LHTSKFRYATDDWHQLQKGRRIKEAADITHRYDADVKNTPTPISDVMDDESINLNRLVAVNEQCYACIANVYIYPKFSEDEIIRRFIIDSGINIFKLNPWTDETL
jgi:hypothetical protein